MGLFGGGGGLPGGNRSEWPGAVDQTQLVTVLVEPRHPDDEPRGAMVTSRWGLVGDGEPDFGADSFFSGPALRRRFGLKK